MTLCPFLPHTLSYINLVRQVLEPDQEDLESAVQKESPPCFDLVVIGAGSGGMAAAKRAGHLGAQVALVERGRTGGTCVLRGCIPKKWMVYAAELAADRSLHGCFGLGEAPDAARAPVQWQRLVTEREALIGTLVHSHERALEAASVTRFEGSASFLDAHHIAVGNTVIEGKSFLIATGGAPVLGRWPGADKARVSDDFFAATAPPASVIVVGGGYIAVEFAGILGRLGIACTLVCRSRLLRAFDQEVAEGMQSALQRYNVRVLNDASVVRQDTLANGYERLTVRCGSTTLELDGQWVLSALGRSPCTGDLNLGRAGVDVASGAHLQVDALQRTQVPHIFAVGDVTEQPELTPVAIRAGRRVAHHLFDPSGGGPLPLEGAHVPTAVFGPEPLAAVGLTETQAEERFGSAVGTRVSRYVPLRQMRLPKDKQVRSIIKVVFERGSKKVLGMHMLGADAPEIMQGMAVALSAGVTLDALDATVALHPTQAEEFVLMGGP